MLVKEEPFFLCNPHLQVNAVDILLLSLLHFVHNVFSR